MTAEHLQKLWTLAQPGSGVIPQSGKYFEPLCSIYPAEAAAAVAAALAGDDLSLQSLAQRLLAQNRARIYPLAGADQPLYHNVNLPDDLK